MNILKVISIAVWPFHTKYINNFLNPCIIDEKAKQSILSFEDFKTYEISLNCGILAILAQPFTNTASPRI